MASIPTDQGYSMPLFEMVSWTTFRTDRLMLERMWRDLNQRMENLLDSLGRDWRRDHFLLIPAGSGRVGGAGNWTENRYSRLRERLATGELDMVASAWTFGVPQKDPFGGEDYTVKDADVDIHVRSDANAVEVTVKISSSYLTLEEEDQAAAVVRGADCKFISG